MALRVALGTLLVLAASLGIPHVASTAKDPCRRCRTECREDIEPCIESDPRLASCPPQRIGSCRRRAKRACKRNRKACCLKTCRTTGQVVCCGSATSATTLPGATTTTTADDGSTTTNTLSSSTTTTIAPGCTTDLDCPSCGCCDVANHVCVGATGNGTTICCNVPPTPTPLTPGVCGPQSPPVCPVDAVCAPPGQLAGGIQYACQFCAGSGRIIEQYFPSDQLPKSFPSNECLRR
jgi:hypothetical protein